MDQLFTFIANHYILCSGFAVVLLAVIYTEFNSPSNQQESLAPQDVVLKINHEEAVVVDIRDHDLYQKGHIINSIHVNNSEISKAKLNKYKNNTIILVCTLGKTAKTSAATLKKSGFSKVYVLAGGIEAWKNANLPLIKSQ